MSRASAPKIASTAVWSTPWNCGLFGAALLFAHVWNVWLSQSPALGAFHGASSGTDCDIWSSWAMAAAAGTRIWGSVGAAPAGPVSLNLSLFGGLLTPS